MGRNLGNSFFLRLKGIGSGWGRIGFGQKGAEKRVWRGQLKKGLGEEGVSLSSLRKNPFRGFWKGKGGKEPQKNLNFFGMFFGLKEGI